MEDQVALQRDLASHERVICEKPMRN